MAFTIGVDIGGTKVLGGVVDEEGKIVATARRNTPAEGGRALTQTIADVALELRAHYPVESIGISAAGLISADRKTLLATPNIKNWNGVSLQEDLTRLIHARIVIENDANAAAWGEFRFGAGRGRSQMVMLTIGTGVGGGIVINGEIYRGAFGIGAELGHMRLISDGEQCGCGAFGCVERYASGSALMRYAHEGALSDPGAAAPLFARAGSGELRGSDITEAAMAGDPFALSLFEKLGGYLGSAIASLSSIIDPELFIIGGGVIDAGDLFLNPTRRAFLSNLPFAGMRPVAEIAPATLGNDAGLIGVADLARR